VKSDTPLGVLINHIERVNRFQGPDGNAGFFKNFPFSSLLHGFTDFHPAAGNRPQIFSRRLAPSNQQDLIVFKYNGPDGNPG